MQQERWFRILPNIIRDSRSGFTVVFCGLALAVFTMLVFRNAGLNPAVFADEWIYSSSSRLFAIDQSVVPSYLFLLLFENTSRCGTAFLECARLLNAFLVMASMPFIYMTARRYVSKLVGLLIASLTALGPINSYSAYFMPETLYFLSFWIFVWYALGATALRSPWRYGAVIGLILGLMMAIKFHAIFLLAGFCVFVTLCVIVQGKRIKPSTGMKIACAAVPMFFLTRFVLGYSIAGMAGLSLTGNFYGKLADSALEWAKLMDLIPLTLEVLSNHVLALSMMFAVPVATLLVQAKMQSTSMGTNKFVDSRLPLLPFVSGMLVVLLIVTALFSASVAGQGGYESAERLHMRYYDFIFPLFYILVAAQLGVEEDSGNARWRVRLSALLVGGLAIYTLLVAMHRFIPNHVDHPDLRGFMAHPTASIVLGGLGIFALLFWAVQRHRGAQLYLFLFLPLSIFISSSNVSYLQSLRMTSDVYDRAGKFTRLYLPMTDPSLLIAGADPSALFRTQFHIDNPNTVLAHLAEGEALTASKVPTSAMWLLLFGSHEIHVPTFWEIEMGEYRLLRLAPNNLIDFREAAWPGSVGKIEGLSHAEAFGRWSNAAVVELYFLTPMSGVVQLTLNARAFGPNVGQPFILRIGEEERTFTLQEANQEVSLNFKLSEPTQKLSIIVPQPTSPKALGLSTDNRLLGIAMHKLQIKQVNEASQAH